MIWRCQLVELSASHLAKRVAQAASPKELFAHDGHQTEQVAHAWHQTELLAHAWIWNAQPFWGERLQELFAHCISSLLSQNRGGPVPSQAPRSLRCFLFILPTAFRNIRSLSNLREPSSWVQVPLQMPWLSLSVS